MDDLLTSLSLVYANEGAVLTEEVQILPNAGGIPMDVIDMMDGVGAIVARSIEHFRQMRYRFPRDFLALVVYMENNYTTHIVHHPFRTQRRFTSLQDIRDHLAESIEDAFYNLAQSDRELYIEDIVWTIRIYRNMNTPAQGRIKAYVKKTINSSDHTNGLYQYQNDDRCCGFKAVLYHLTMYKEELMDYIETHFHWILDRFEQDQIAWNSQNIQAKRRFLQMAQTLAQQMGVVEPYDWVVGPGQQSSALKFVSVYPRFQVLIYNEPTRQLMEHRKGSEFNHADHPERWTLCMSYSLGHLKLIRGLFLYFGKKYKAGNVFCYQCGSLQTREQHPCNVAIQCTSCLMKFTNAEELKEHRRGMNVFCGKCNRTFMNDACLDYHHCLASHVNVCSECNGKVFPNIQHRCGSHRCLTCKEWVGQGHECQMQRPDNPSADARPEIEGEHYYAFDLESMLIHDGESRRHIVNLVVVRRVFTNQEWIFHSLNDFVLWFEALEEVSYLFAHNMKGYDGRMVFEYLIDMHKPPQTIIWNGSKIMTMQYGKVHFRDTLLHLPASLAELPKMMGLDEQQYKKGFFPYLFNTPENQTYVGPMPNVSYFEPHSMSPKKRDQFLIWHREQTQMVGDQYDFHKELVEYCQSDVHILAETIKAYMTQQMSRYPLNPLNQLTIASYAMALYKIYHMPENSFYRLTMLEDSRIRQSMHGGRTDTRRMLKEWTPEEVASGYYGKYQDVQSLYPTVQFYDPLPVGKPEYLTWGPDSPINVDELKSIFGFVCCDLECLDTLFHPIIVHTHENGRLVADLNPKHKIVVPTPELHLALDHGYRVTRLYWAYKFDYSTELFKSYFQDFLKDKLEASGIPKWVESDEDWYEFQQYHYMELGIELERHQMIPNPSRKTGAKLLCNSLWGKFGERLHMNNWKICEVGKDDGEIMALEKLWIDGDVDLTYRRFNRSNTHLAMAYKINNPRGDHVIKKHLGRVNIALASMVTSHARCRLWKELHKLGRRVLYHDTDSIIYEHDPCGYNIPEGRYLGEWEDETGGLPITKFTSTGPKCYSYVVQQPDGTEKVSTKVKGITLNSFNQDRVNYESMKKLVTGDLSEVETQSLMFKYDRVNGTMITKTVIKLLKQVYEKGEIDETDWVVYPYGYHQLLQRNQAAMTLTTT